jgi:hypothetical protein
VLSGPSRWDEGSSLGIDVGEVPNFYNFPFQLVRIVNDDTWISCLRVAALRIRIMLAQEFILCQTASRVGQEGQPAALPVSNGSAMVPAELDLGFRIFQHPTTTGDIKLPHCLRHRAGERSDS